MKSVGAGGDLIRIMCARPDSGDCAMAPPEGALGGRVMKRNAILLALAFACPLSLSACQTPQQQTGTLVGGALGAGTGALIGSAVSHGSAGGAIAGGVIGGVGGAMIGNAVTRPHYCVRHGYDVYGNRICVRWSS